MPALTGLVTMHMTTRRPFDMGARFDGPAFVRDPYPTYEIVRTHGPVWRDEMIPGGGWCVAGYSDVVALLRESRCSKDFTRLVPDSLLTAFDRTMLFKDSQEHLRLRGLVSAAFTAERVHAIEGKIREVAEDLCTAALPASTVEFVRSYAAPLPVIVIAELLGVPGQDRNLFRNWSDRIVVTRTAEERRLRRMALTDLADYLRLLTEQRRRRRQKDLISELLDSVDSDDSTGLEELISTCILLLVAGHETTLNLLGNGLATLLDHPQQLEYLRRNPGSMDIAVEEMLRFESPIQETTFRVATRALRVGNCDIAVGEQVSGLLGAANRDPAVFSEPNRFNILRRPNAHLAFGGGAHYCLGASLARTEARIGLNVFLHRAPRINKLDEAIWGSALPMRTLTALPLECRTCTVAAKGRFRVGES
jgi:pimeloyl-[acyl-carrier protein] synthase